MDSTGGRGSYAGLAECLQTVLANVTTKQTALFVTCEEMYSTSNEKVSHSVDLVLDGVWSSVAAALVERFPGMFTVGIAGTFSRCYLAIENFLVGLAKVGGPNFQECISNRLAVHPKVREFQSKWRLPLYLQLRTQEITYRIDRICELSRTKGATHESINKIHTAQGTITAIPISNETASLKPSSVSVPTASSLQEIESTVTSTLSEEDIRSLSNSLNLERVFSCTLVRAFVLESSTCLHPKIALRPLGAKFLSLSLKIWARFEVHLCTLLSISMPSLESAVILSDGGEVPLKRLTSTGNLTQVQSSTSVLRIEDLMTLCKDVIALVVWLDSDYLEACKSYFHEVSMFEIVKSCVKSQSQKMNNFRGALWSHICALLTAVS